MQTLKDYLEGQPKAKFAERVGISPAYLSQILGGVRRPGLNLAVTIERETGGSVPVSVWAQPLSPSSQRPPQGGQ